MMADIRHLENQHDVIFSAEGGPIWIKFRRLEQNDMSTAVIWSNSKPDVEFQYGGRLGEFHGMPYQSHLPHCRMLPPGEFNVMIPEVRVTLQGAVTWRNQCHESWSCHVAGCKNSIHHIENRFSPNFILFLFFFKCCLGFDERRLSDRLRYTCHITNTTMWLAEMPSCDRTVFSHRYKGRDDSDYQVISLRQPARSQ